MLPAAILGLLVVRIVVSMPLPDVGRAPFFLRHVALSLLFSLCWIAAVVLVRNVGAVLTDGSWPNQYPPLFIVRWHVLAGVMIYAAIASSVYAVQIAARSREDRRRAELKALRAQLSPHFLFNTLHTIMALFRSRPAAAEGALETFADLMRYALNHDALPSSRSTVRDDWAFTEAYLELEAMRLDDRLRTEVDIDPATLDCLVPPLLIQPLVENAVQHAVAKQAEGATVHVSIGRQGRRLSVCVRDDGKTRAPVSPSSGIGLEAVRARLQACFGDAWELTTERLEPTGFRAVVDMPFQPVAETGETRAVAV